MKTIGLIGGMSWESTIPYYQIINETVKDKLGGFHSAKILMYSVDFAELESYMSTGQWDKNAEILSTAAQTLEKGGADFIVICTNTMHKLVPKIQEKITIPILHIADATADVLVQHHIRKVALLGTRYTMLQDFYKERLHHRGFEIMIPDNADIGLVNHVIFDELCLGIINDDSRKQYIRIIEQMKSNGAEGVILGCTEIGLLIQQKDTSLPVFDTTVIHARTAALKALEQ